jgi:hypothetical protein
LLGGFGTLDVDNFSIVEGADDLENRINSPDVTQKRIPETSSGRRSLCQTSDIVDRQKGGDFAGWFVRLAQPRESKYPSV